MTVLSSENPTARKPHRCVLCDGTIPKGQTYRRWSNADGGTVVSSKAHDFCVLVAWYWQAERGWVDDDVPWPEEFRSEELRPVLAALTAVLLPLPADWWHRSTAVTGWRPTDAAG